MPLALNEIEKTIETVECLVDPSSERYGRLLNWQNPPDRFRPTSSAQDDVRSWLTSGVSRVQLQLNCFKA